jgi:hypothetical protein
MKAVQQYLEHAHECQQLAGRARTDEDRNAMLKMAEAWEELAKSREVMLQRRARLSRFPLADFNQRKR